MKGSYYRNYSRLYCSHEKFARSLFEDEFAYGAAGDLKKRMSFGSILSMYTDHRSGANLKASKTGLTLPIVSVGKSGVFNNLLKFRGKLFLDSNGQTVCTATAMSIPPLSDRKCMDTWQFMIQPEVVNRKGEMIVKYCSTWLTSKCGRFAPSFKWRNTGCVLILSVQDTAGKVNCLALAIDKPKSSARTSNKRKKCGAAAASAAPTKHGNAAKKTKKTPTNVDKVNQTLLSLTHRLQDQVTNNPEQSRLIALSSFEQITKMFDFEVLSQQWEVYRYYRESGMFPANNSEPVSSKSSSQVIDPGDDYDEGLLKELIDSIDDVQVNAVAHDSTTLAPPSTEASCTVERVGHGARASGSPASAASTAKAPPPTARDGVQESHGRSDSAIARAGDSQVRAESTSDALLSQLANENAPHIETIAHPPATACDAAAHAHTSIGEGPSNDGGMRVHDEDDGALEEGWVSSLFLDQLVQDVGHVSS